jgi:hypothetical protein
MQEKVKALLERHGYLLRLTYIAGDEEVRLFIPGRIQEPSVESHNIIYKIRNNILDCSVAGETSLDIQCPNYAIRTLMFVDVRRVCDYLHFDPSLLEFYNGDDKITEVEFTDMIWPKDVEFTDEMRKQEYSLREIVSRAANAIVPFHESFNFEAQQMGVGLGYKLIRAFALGDIE